MLKRPLSPLKTAVRSLHDSGEAVLGNLSQPYDNKSTLSWAAGKKNSPGVALRVTTGESEGSDWFIMIMSWWIMIWAEL